MFLHLLDFLNLLITEEIMFYKYPNYQDNIKMRLLFEEIVINSSPQVTDFYSLFPFFFFMF